MPCPIKTSDFQFILTVDGAFVCTTGDCDSEGRAGLYQLVPGKRNDTIYITADETVDVKIP